jgi:hypothetical protein
MMRPSRQSGSAFFVILIAIAMFAALSYAISRGSSMNAAALTDKQAEMAAQELIAFANTVQKAVHTMRLRGFAEHNLDFSNPVYRMLNNTPITAANTSCTTNDCRVFVVGGGGVTAIAMPQNMFLDQTSWANTLRSGHAGFRVVRIQGVGSTAPELTIFFPWVRKEVCLKLNNQLGITNPAGNPPVDAEGVMVDYTGALSSFPALGAGMGLGDSATGLAGKSMFCTENAAASGHFYFWAVLLAR